MADTARVPGPPRGRRRDTLGAALTRIETMRNAETGGSGVTSLLRLLGDVILLLKDLVTDPRVPRADKVVAGLAAAYLVSPVDIVPDWLPVLGQADDLAVITLALRRLLTGAGYDVIYDLWQGNDEGLALVLTLAGVQE